MSLPYSQPQIRYIVQGLGDEAHGKYEDEDADIAASVKVLPVRSPAYSPHHSILLLTLLSRLYVRHLQHRLINMRFNV